MKESYSNKTPMSCCYRLHAIRFGHREAVILFHFMFWVDHNRKKEKHFHKGKYWSYGSISDLKKYYFPFLSKGQVRGGIQSLLKQNVIIKDNFNKFKYDKTLWYALIDEDGLEAMEIQFDEHDRSDELQ